MLKRIQRGYIRVFITAVLALTIILGLCCSARSQMAIKTWDQHFATIQSAYASLPSAFKPDSIPIYVESVGEDELVALNTLIYPDSTTKPDEIRKYLLGQYLMRLDKSVSKIRPNLPTTAMIFLKKSGRSRQEITTTFRHEWGHHVYRAMMNDKERADWRDIYSVAAIQHKLPSLYAFTNEREGWAEVFECWLSTPKELDPIFNPFLNAVKERLEVARGIAPKWSPLPETLPLPQI